MTGFNLLIAILLPILGGALVPLLDFGARRARESYVFAIVVATSLFTLSLLGSGQGTQIVLYHLTSTIDITLRLDRYGSVFALLVSVLWPLATLYAFEYMSHLHKKNRFFGFFTMCFGITLGIAFAGNFITMYLFYELLTLATVPLITHEGTREAKVAGVKYLVYSIAGATAACANARNLPSQSGCTPCVSGSTGSGSFVTSGRSSGTVKNSSIFASTSCSAA